MSAVELKADAWHDPSEKPEHGEPVIAEFNEWNVATNPLKEHVVWWWEGEWRMYPNTDDRAYVNRWRRFDTRPPQGDAASIALREALTKIRNGLDLVDPSRPLQYADAMDLMRKCADQALSATPSDSGESMREGPTTFGAALGGQPSDS